MAELTNSEKKARLTHLMKVLKMNRKTFVETVGIKSLYNQYRKKNPTPLAEEVLKVITEHFRITPDYFETDNIGITQLVIEDGFVKTKPLKSGLCVMRLLTTTVSANFDSPLTEQTSLFEEYAVSQKIFQRYGDNSILARVEGKSMSPTIPKNAIVVITKIQNWKEVEHQIIAIAYDGIFTVKRIKKNDYKSGYIMLYPENPDYTAKQIDIKEIHEVFKVERIIDAEVE